MALKFSELADVTGSSDDLEELLNGNSAAMPEFSADPAPDYGKTSLEDRMFSDANGKATAAGKRVTTAVRKDVRGKVAMLLMVGGSAFAARDPQCGGALLDAIPDRDTPEDEGEPVTGLATALTDLICDSPDIVKWFTTSGSYMKWLTLALAIQPVVTSVVHHHITHTISDDPNAEPNWEQYGSS